MIFRIIDEADVTGAKSSWGAQGLSLASRAPQVQQITVKLCGFWFMAEIWRGKLRLSTYPEDNRKTGALQTERDIYMYSIQIYKDSNYSQTIG